ncbi:MAG TPA: hypothetical protein VMZ29_16175 [Candidatus Bathyarchaeia archaeon]|nr:hypothetical protein [Candidatus Bathyarchaeia archaeon]
MTKQNAHQKIKGLISSALIFTFSDRKQLIFSLLSFLLPFLLFFPILFIGLSVQSSFLIEYQSLHPLEQDEQYSVGYYFSQSYLSNTSEIPTNLWDEIDRDISDIFYYSNLGEYINGYLSFCDAQLQYYSNEMLSPSNVIFLHNETFQQIAKYFTLSGAFPNSYDECILVQKTDLSSYTPQEYSYSIGDKISILPSYEENGLIVNGSFIINPLNASVSNIFNINDFLFEDIIKAENPFFYYALINYIGQISSHPLLLFNIDYFTDFFHFFPKLFYSEIRINIQFLYDFSSAKVTDLKEIYRLAEDLPNLSGFSYYHDLSALVSSELADFLALFRNEIRLQWFRLFAIGLASLVFSLFIIWLSFSSNILKLSDIYANFLTRGYSRKTILNIFAISRFIEISISCFCALILAIPLTYLNLAIISNLVKVSSLTLNLISFSTVFIPSLLFFIFLFIFSLVNLRILIKRVEKFFPQRLSSFTVRTTSSTKTQVLVTGLSGLFSLLSMSSLLIIRYFLNLQDVLSSEIMFVLDVFLYIFISITILCFLFILINSLLKQLVRLSHSIWKKSSKKISIIMHNLSLAFQHHKKQSFFIALSFLIFIQSFLIPAYLSQHATNSAKFELGSDVSIQLENSTNTSPLLSDISLIPSVLAVSNYSLVQVSIFDIDYHVLVVSQTFGSTVFYSNDINIGISKDDLVLFSNTANAILTQSQDIFLNSKINYGLENNTIKLSFNNISADDQFIKEEFTVYSKYNLFPILLNDYQLSTIFSEQNSIPFIAMTESSFQKILEYKEDISIVYLKEAIIIKLNKQSEIRSFLQALESTPYSMIYSTWTDVYPSYLPTFATSIIAISIISGSFAALSFFIASGVLVQDMLNTRREGILVLRYRGFSLRTISKNFIIEYLFVLLLILPISCGAGIGSLIFLLRVLIKAENWVLNVPYYFLYSIYLSIILLAIIGLDILIRHFYHKKFFGFQPSIMEGT